MSLAKLLVIRIPRGGVPRGLTPGRDQYAVPAARRVPSWDLRLRPASWADPVGDNERHCITLSHLEQGTDENVFFGGSANVFIAFAAA
jgi:hypothetical protein